MLSLMVGLAMSVAIAYGLAVALVEKGKEWPIRRYNILLRSLLHRIYWKAPFALYCVTCTSFWMALLSDICVCVVCLLCGQSFYFLWPISGFVTVGFTWTIVQFLNALGAKQNIVNNNYIIPQPEDSGSP